MSKCCYGRGVEPNVANPSGICMQCGAERFGINPIAQAHFDKTGEFLLPDQCINIQKTNENAPECINKPVSD